MVLIGTPSVDPTIRGFKEFLMKAGLQHLTLDLVSVARAKAVEVTWHDNDLEIVCDKESFYLQAGVPVYQRIFLPSGLQECQRELLRRVNAEVLAFLEGAPGLVVNRPHSGASNSCKALHMADLASTGFHIPDWHVFGASRGASAIVNPDGNWINKGCGGTRSIACVVDRYLYSMFESLESTPSLFQRNILGTNARLHCVGAEYHALEIACLSADYRYLSAGDAREVHPVEVPEHIRLSCLEYMRREDAQFLGFDFRISQDTKQWMLLEANPMPGFDFYDRLSEGKISALLAGLLSGELDPVPKLDYTRRPEIGVIGEERLPSVAN
jgi:hypothetical protein